MTTTTSVWMMMTFLLFSTAVCNVNHCVRCLLPNICVDCQTGYYFDGNRVCTRECLFIFTLFCVKCFTYFIVCRQPSATFQTASNVQSQTSAPIASPDFNWHPMAAARVRVLSFNSWQIIKSLSVILILPGDASILSLIFQQFRFRATFRIVWDVQEQISVHSAIRDSALWMAIAVSIFVCWWLSPYYY